MLTVASEAQYLPPAMPSDNCYVQDHALVWSAVASLLIIVLSLLHFLPLHSRKII